MVKLSIIILTYNCSKHIQKCVESIFDYFSLPLLKGEYELLIVDNSSSDTTLSVLQKYFSKRFKKEISLLGQEREIEITKTIRVVKHFENYGFARGMNKGVLKAHGEYILFLNPDTEFVDGNLFEMIEILEGEKLVSVVCGKILTDKGTDELSAGVFYNFFSIIFFVFGLDQYAGLRFSPQKKRYIDYGSGGFMLVDAEKFKDIGGFDENFFMYIEDMELCFRMKKCGWGTIFYPYATIKHYGQGSSDRTYAVINILKGMIYFFKKHKSRSYYEFARSLLMGKAYVGIFVGGLTHNMYLTRTYKKALNILI